VTLAAVVERHDVAPEKDPERRPHGGRRAARDRLRRFVERLPDYPRNVAPPAAERYGSRLSPYLTFGVLSTREVYQRVQRCPESHERSMFTSRLFWNHHYRQKLADWPGWTDRAVNPVFRGLHRGEHDPDLERAWREGETGFLMDSREPADITAGIEAILARDDLDEVSRRGRALVEEEYSLAAAVERYRAILTAATRDDRG
jgi:deoxyribodipyrimidine photo-lyase